MSTSFQRVVAAATYLSSQASRSSLRAGCRSPFAAQWTCWSCRTKQQLRDIVDTSTHTTRAFSASTRQRDDQESSKDMPSASNGLPNTPAARSNTLPSHSAKQRSAFSRRLSDLTDSVLARASIAGQHINTYTGTDYSGIEALRNEITEQESGVRERHAAVGEAKDRHAEARAKQASSQKEIVGLLERKSSWSPTDLERYMTLVRSEHIDDQAVQKALENLAIAERELEGSRSLLEKLERKQYHEEQVWSDTIRRNSTWVTIGLMGANILLLLAQIAIFEPYRRRKIVKQIKEALDERSPEASLPVSLIRQIDDAVEPADVSLEQLEVVEPLIEPLVAAEDSVSIAEPAMPADLVLEPPLVNDQQGYFQLVRATVDDLFSERTVQLRQVDITTIALKGAAAGIACATVIALLILRSAH